MDDGCTDGTTAAELLLALAQGPGCHPTSLPMCTSCNQRGATTMCASCEKPLHNPEQANELNSSCCTVVPSTGAVFCSQDCATAPLCHICHRGTPDRSCGTCKRPLHSNSQVIRRGLDCAPLECGGHLGGILFCSEACLSEAKLAQTKASTSETTNDTAEPYCGEPEAEVEACEANSPDVEEVEILEARETRSQTKPTRISQKKQPVSQCSSMSSFWTI